MIPTNPWNSPCSLSSPGERVPADFTGTSEEVVARINALGLLDGSVRNLRTFNLLAAGEEDAFALASVTIAVIPVPAGAPLLVAGLGGLWLLRRRRGRSAG